MTIAGSILHEVGVRDEATVLEAGGDGLPAGGEKSQHCQNGEKRVPAA